MRRQATQNGLTVQAIAGTHAVLLGFDVDGLDQLDAVGFAIRRTDHIDDERYWLWGMKVLKLVVPTRPWARTIRGGITLCRASTGESR